MSSEVDKIDVEIQCFDCRAWSRWRVTQNVSILRQNVHCTSCNSQALDFRTTKSIRSCADPKHKHPEAYRQEELLVLS